MPIPGGAFGFGQVVDDVLDVKLDRMPEVEADGINDKVDGNACPDVGEDYLRPLEVPLGVIVEVVRPAVRAHAGIKLVAQNTLENVVLFEWCSHVAPRGEAPVYQPSRV
jgi:hypothetical protein